MIRPLGWLRARMGVRAVSALSAAVVVALALLVAGAALVLLVQQSLRNSVRTEAMQQAELIAVRVEGNYEGNSNENAREAISALTRESEDLAQVVVEYGGDSGAKRNLVVEAGTDPLGHGDGVAPMSDLWPDEGETIMVPRAPVRKLDDTVVDSVLVAMGTESAGRHVVVLYAVPLTGVEAATGLLLFYLLWGIPLLIVIAGATTYLFAGRALRPVEAMRAQVAELTDKDLGQRVPVPPARDEVGRLAETMNDMLARLQDAQGVQRRFVADASHELRSPLATIATGLELLEKRSGDAGTVTALRGETSRLGNLVDGLILLARADERGLQPRREEVDLDEVAELERGRPADGAVTAEVRTTPARVIGDRAQLARVVRNLVDNARRHARSRVLVTVAKEDRTAVIEVSDDGPGVPPADRARVFERFVRLDDARARRDGGSGLGLAIVAEVVAAHGGTVEVTDAAGGGALFRVRLPTADESHPQSGDEPVLAAGQTQQAPPVPAPPAQAPAPQPARPASDTRFTPAPAPRPGARQPAQLQQRPVRDHEARQDPDTAPQGIPVVPAEQRAPGRPHPVPAPRSQPGSAIR